VRQSYDIGKHAEVLRLILAVLECNLRANLIRKKPTKIKIERIHKKYVSNFLTSICGVRT